MNDTSDWYEVLGVATTADATIIKAAYRARAKNLHPDSAHATDQQEFARINRAYEILSDPARRAAYDAERERQAASQTTPQSPETGPDPDDYEDTWGTEGTWGDEP
uniref:J domain-containing protein n=1 Tax=Janibacter corallicola TaxID=415212 RepID=UPI000ADBA600